MPSDRPAGFWLTPQALFGLLIIGAGLLLTADNLHWYDADRLLRYWPIGIVLVGALKLAQSQSSSGRVLGGIVVVVGMLLAAEHTLGWKVDVSDLWFPLALIVLGVMVILRANDSVAKERPPQPATDDGPVVIDPEIRSTMPPPLPSFSPTHATSSADAKISEVAIWAGKQRRNASAAFRYADLTAVMGGIELDLRGASTANGEAVIDLFVMWGGIEIWVPPDWLVSNQVGVLMAGAEDKSTGVQGARNRLVVRGFAIMGGVEIKT